MNNKLIISAAITGAGTTKAMAPSVPITAEEIGDEVVNVARAGASIVHIHVRDDQGEGTMDKVKFEEAFCTIRDRCVKAGIDIIINLTTSGGGNGNDEDRLVHLKSLKPEMCSFDAGTMNWDNQYIFENSPRFLEKLGHACLENDIKPEIEIFDASMIGNAMHYIKNGILKSPCHFQFVLGIAGGLDGTIDSLNFMLPKLPEGSTWSVTGIGKRCVPMMLAGLAAGADGLRVGLEDNVRMGKGVSATNVDLVKRCSELAKISGREIAIAQEAREILGISRKSW